MRIEDGLGPEASWLDAAGRRLHQVSAETAARFAVRVTQRTRRSWSDEDLWSLGDTLRRTLGAQLAALAAQTNGYPGDGQWGERGERWAPTPAASRAGAQHLPKGLSRNEQEAYREEVRTSLHWVADHFEYLGW